MLMGDGHCLTLKGTKHKHRVLPGSSARRETRGRSGCNNNAGCFSLEGDRGASPVRHIKHFLKEQCLTPRHSLDFFIWCFFFKIYFCIFIKELERKEGIGGHAAKDHRQGSTPGGWGVRPGQDWAWYSLYTVGHWGAPHTHIIVFLFCSCMSLCVASKCASAQNVLSNSTLFISVIPLIK